MFPPLPDDPRREDWENSEFSRTHAGLYELILAERRSRDALPDIYTPREEPMNDRICIFIDGGCLNNGQTDPKGYASISVTYQGQRKYADRMDLPKATTNNLAEYGALFMAINYINGLKDRATRVLPEITICTDSALIANQVNGTWKVKKDHLRQYCDTAVTWLKGNPGVELVKVDREMIVSQLGH